MFRALLVGVPHYRDDTFPDLPFIDDDLVELSAALTGCGYDVESHERGSTDSDSIQYAIESFIVNADPGDTLLVYLSGHGVHYNGMDYLIPSTAMANSSSFPSRNCVQVDCDAYVEGSAAATVVVFFDACREGITLRNKSGFAEAWGEWQRDKTVAQQVAYFYACSPGQTAGFSGAGFSMLSRALCQALTDESEPRTLAELLKTTRDKMSALIKEHEVRPHQARVRADVDLSEIVVVPREGPSGEHPWVTAVREHKVWSEADPRGMEVLREHTTSLVRRLTKDLAPDPWVDHEAFALVMSRKVQWLVCTVNNKGRLALSAADAALLVAFPFVHQAYWSRLATDEWPSTDPDFSRFRAGYPRLERRIASAAEADATNIERWLFLRWLVARPTSYDEKRLPRLDGLAGEVFAPDQVVRILRALRMDATLLPDLLPAVRGVAASSDEEQEVHAQLVGFLLVAAHRFAIDPLDLPQVIVDHLGTGDPVDLRQLATTLAGATWEKERRSRSLRARCHHQAVHRALKLHADAVNALLVQIERIGPDALDMPSHANAELLEAAVGPDGLPLQIAEGFRFRLAEDQVQELLMGEQLYGDPALAVRELYQNALDACRYRRARTKYLVAEKQPVPADWHPKIEFHQGVADGRPYLDCVDNGVGMGLRELTGLFAHAGVRFTTLPEYLEEEALWREHGIKLYPNSRFGIGVLSYFMLADEITVTTCRFNRNGCAGDRLEVHISGPGTLSRVRRMGKGTEAGTTVRLYLRKEVSCVNILRRILWVSEFDATATDHTGSISWTAGQLYEQAPIGGVSRTLRARAVRATSVSTVWWCEGRGGVLADGLWADKPIHGAVVNLTGPHIPKLTVNRQRIVEYDENTVRQQLWTAIPDLVAPESKVLTHEWLTELAKSDSQIADEIHRQRLEVTDQPWVVAGREVNLAVLGFFAMDKVLFTPQRRSSSETGPPENIVSWRLRTWVEAGQIPGLTASSTGVRARPSDIDMLSRPGATIRDREWITQLDVPVGHVVAFAARTELDPRDVLGRLTALGYRTDRLSSVADRLDATAGVLTSFECTGEPPWLPSNDHVPPGHVVNAALKTGLSFSEVVARLTMFGFDTSLVGPFRGAPNATDLTMLADNFTRNSWLSPTELVPPGHVLDVAKRLHMAPAEVADRLREFGHRVHHPKTWPEPDKIALTVTSKRLNRRSPWLDPRTSVSPVRIAGAASRCQCSIDDVLAVLHALSFRTPDPDVVIVPLDDYVWAPRVPDLQWRGFEQPVPHGHVAWASIEARLPVVDVVKRLAAYGFQVGDTTQYLRHYDPDDLLLLSQKLNGRSPWRADPSQLTAEEIIYAAWQFRRSAYSVAERALALGIDAPEPSTFSRNFDADDGTFIRAAGEGSGKWLDRRQPVPALHIMAVAAETRRSVDDVSTRLRELGYELDAMPPSLDREDELLFSMRALRDVTEQISTTHLAQICRSGRDVAEAAKRLVRLGMRLPEGIEFAD